MQSIINSIVQHLKHEVPSLRYISRNWNQLSYEQPPVQFPCALVDIDSLSFSELKHGAVSASGSLSVTVANSVIHRDNPKATDNFLDTVQHIADALNLFQPSGAQPLILSSMSKAYSDRSFDVYTLTFSTAWTRKYQPLKANKPDPVIITKKL